MLHLFFFPNFDRPTLSVDFYIVKVIDCALHTLGELRNEPPGRLNGGVGILINTLFTVYGVYAGYI